MLLARHERPDLLWRDKAELVDALAYRNASDPPRMVWAALDDWRKNLLVLDEPSRNGTPVPLRYSFSYGGKGHDENPVGRGLDNPDDRPRVIAASTSEKRPKSGAFNAIPRHWPHRAAMVDTYDEAWQKQRAPLLPADLDSGFWQSAPQDQQLPADHVAGRVLMLSGMSDTRDNMEIHIPAPEFEIFTRFRGRWLAQQPRLQTVLVSVPHEMLAMCWLAELPIEAAQNDVFVDRSIISLRSAAGFSVRPGDIALFGPDRTQEDA